MALNLSLANQQSLEMIQVTHSPEIFSQQAEQTFQILVWFQIAHGPQKYPEDFTNN